MKIAGIIAEYHPFHSGHAHLCGELRARGYTHIAAVMSGNFVQRGECAVLDKWTRARAALSGGVDLVLELPLPYALATAETFARGGVVSLSALGCVDALAFGSECGDASALLSCARVLLSPRLGEALAVHLAGGVTFAQARQRAVADMGNEELAALLCEPNNTLGVEYCKQLLLQKCAMEPVAVLRAGAGHDSPAPAAGFASGTYLRGFLEAGETAPLVPFVPASALSLYRDALEESRGPVNRDAVELLTLARLRGMALPDIAALPDISEGLEHRIFSAARRARSLEEFYSLVKTKRYTLARIRRIACAALAGLRAQDQRTPPPYLRVLGMNGRGREILAEAKETASLPVSTSLARLREYSPEAARFAALEASADDLYHLCLPVRRSCGADFTENAVIL
ncbi:tRNA(Met) cytidine acetate ligase [Zongyangia hominis]|uniref:tRNA(Met) cytidine acetate ligase n=1 Tax=Zongyangia hominis TaxID=2763677 RepID=A0A926EEN1_9FIRM|nr:nucleotidyltransferase family protein [Zongyangia hominis]MBC8570774.1 nucleotidyltransferase family protein [Zongyangia hominis]